MFDFDDSLASKDAYHFVGYVPFDGRLYELDGLREGPIDLGKCDSQNWLKSVHPVLDRRMQRFGVCSREMYGPFHRYYLTCTHMLHTYVHIHMYVQYVRICTIVLYNYTRP